VLRYLFSALTSARAKHNSSPIIIILSISCLDLYSPNIKTPLGSRQSNITRLFAAQLAALHHSSVLLLESLVQALRALEVLVDAAHDALLFAVDEGLGGEIVDAVIEAALDHLGVHLERGVRFEIESKWEGSQRQDANMS
jgi:hypothetical protein